MLYYEKHYKNKSLIAIFRGFALTLLTTMLVIGGVTLTGSKNVSNEFANRIFLECEENEENGGVDLTVKYCGNTGICGIIFLIEYSADNLRLIDAMSECRSLKCTYRCDENKILILLDGYENTESEINLVRLKFELVGNNIGDVEFCATPHGKEYAYYLNERNELVAARVDFSAAKAVWIKNETADEKRSVDLTNTRIISVRNQEMVVELSGYTTKYNAFAAGFKVYIADLDNGVGDGFYTVGVLEIKKNIKRNDVIRGFKQFITLNTNGRLCLIITPISYTNKNSHLGQKRLFLIENGEITPIITDCK